MFRTTLIVISSIIVIALLLVLPFRYSKVTPVPSPTASHHHVIVGLETSGVKAEDPILPDSELTPGDTNPSEGGNTDANVVCNRSTSTVRNVPVSTKKQVYDSYAAKYGTQTWAQHTPGHYEVDHLISLELGGSNDPKNLWPESYLAQPLNAHSKDSLENYLHAQVCNGALPLSQAQAEISSNWVEAYKKYMGAR